MLGQAFQIIFAICIVILLFVIAYFIYNKEAINALRSSKDIRRKIPIFDGVKDLLINNNETYDTADPNDPTFRNVNVSVNQKSGAEFSYNFWVYKDATFTHDFSNAITDADLKNTNDVVLFIKGNKKVFKYPNICNQPTKNFLVKCPLVKFEQDMDVLTVELNNNDTPQSVGEGSMNTCTDTDAADWSSKNQHKISVKGFNGQNYTRKWFMVTVVIQDTVSTDALPHRNNIKCLIYVNGIVQLDKYLEAGLENMVSSRATVIKQNKGGLHVAPQVGEVMKLDKSPATDNSGQFKSLYMADLTYYNYALPSADITTLYGQRFNKKVAASVSDSSNTRKNLDDIKDQLSSPTGATQLTAGSSNKSDLMPF